MTSPHVASLREKQPSTEPRGGSPRSPVSDPLIVGRPNPVDPTS